MERDFVDRIGVERLTDGRLKAAGSMSGMVDLTVDKGRVSDLVACGGVAARDAKEEA